MPHGLMFPFGVYDTKSCMLVYIGQHTDEDDCWRVYLGWPDADEIKAAKDSGLRVVPVTVTYDPPRS